MSGEYSYQVLKVCVAQICQNLGWNSTQSTPLELLTDILERYLVQVGKVTHRYAEQFGRTEPNIDDIGLAFRHLNVSPSELGEYIKNADPLPYAHDVVAFPVPKKPNLQFPKPDCREVFTRDESIPEYMPLMHPELEEEESVSTEPSTDTRVTGLLPVPILNQISTSPADGTAVDKHANTPPDGPPFKRRRLDSGALPEDAGPSLYEMKSVIISTSGDHTPTHGKAGKLPDPRTPPQGYPKKAKESPKPSPVKQSKKSLAKEKSDSNKEKIERDLFSETVFVPSSSKSDSKDVQTEIVRPKSTVVSPPGYGPRSKSPGQAKSPKGPGRPPGRPPKSPGRPPLKKSPGRPPMQRSPGRPPLSRSPGRSPFQRSPGRPPLHRSPSRPQSGRSPGRPPKSPRGRPRGFIPVVVKPNRPADIETIERNILERMSPNSQISNEDIKDVISTPTTEQPIDLSLSGKSTESSVSEVVVKTEENEENSQDGSSKLVIVEQSHRPRGRPPISPEKKMARLAAIDDIIDSVIAKSSKNEETIEDKKPVPHFANSDDENKSESKDKKSIFDDGESFDAYVTNVNLDDMQTEVVSEVTIKTEAPEGKDDVNNITLPTGEKIPPLPPPLLTSPPIKRPKGRPKGSGKKKLTTPVKEKSKLKQTVLSETISQVNIFENKSPEVKSPEKKPMDPWMAAMSAAGLSVSVRPPEPEEDTMPATQDTDVSDIVEVENVTIEVGNETVEVKTEPSEIRNEPVVIKTEPLETGKDDNKIKGKSEKSEKSEKSKEHKKKKEKKKKNKNKDRDKEKSKKDKSRETYFPTKLKIKFGGASNKCESTRVIMSPRTESSPSESPRQEGLKLVIKKTTPQISETKPASPSVTSVKKEPKTKEIKKEPKPGLVIEEEPPVLTPEPPKTATPPPPVLRVPSPVPRKNPSKLSIPELPRGVVPSPPPPNLSQPSTSSVPRKREPEAKKFPSPAPTETKTSPVQTPSTPPSSPPHRPESPVEHVNSPHSDTPSTSPYHSPSPSPGPSNPREKFELPPMPPPSIVPPPPPPSKPSSVQRTVVAETIGTFISRHDNTAKLTVTKLKDATGQKVWICPTCKMPDDGSPMIGCDICDDWYHWVCVGIKEDPPEDQSWYCTKCMAPKKQSKRGRKKGSGAGRGRGKKPA
ncbi:transcription initiation factor TFIID subunit 3-like isoform X2 [Mytilus edulis]|uniref:transcription initiation factor TFIID subunit 3-like isoform X2 n=1 Tax=Mytilus edulis TaxID=6550 RepID=UPI0039EE4440